MFKSLFSIIFKIDPKKQYEAAPHLNTLKYYNNGKKICYTIISIVLFYFISSTSSNRHFCFTSGYFSFFHYFVSIFFPTFLSPMALLILLSADTWTRIISANLWDLLKNHAGKFLWKRDYIRIILYVFLPALIC